MNEVYWLALSTIPGIGGKTARRLIERFGSLPAVFDADDDELASVPRITPEIVSGLRNAPLDQLDDELCDLRSEGIRLLTWDSDDYPANLRRADDAPPLLFLMGTIDAADDRAIAVIGSREASEESCESARRLAREFAGRGFTIISGLALGVDAAAHEGALDASGRTLAVLGSGIRHIHPRSNQPIAERIIESGGLLSELHPNTPAQGRNLMARDRIVSGLSLGVIVVEAGLKSGSLDTASKARKQGRLVMAIPGSPGADELISDGAVSIDPSADIDALCEQIEGHEVGAENQLGLW